MSEQIPKTSSKSKSKSFYQIVEWIDYSSEQENDHYEDEQLEQKLKEQNHQQLESQPQKQNSRQKQNYLPVLSTSHEPVKSHILENRKQMLEKLRQTKGNLVWIELSVTNQNSFDYLKEKVEALRNSQNKDIVSVYPSRDNKYGFDFRIAYDLCEKWIVEGIDSKNIIKMELRRKTQRQRETRNEGKYEERRDQYRPVKQYQPQHTASTKYHPKYTEKKKYVEKNAETEQIEKKVQEGLKERKKDQTKKDKGSKFYSKNPFEALNDSD